MPLFGPPDVEKLKAKRDVPGLIRALGYQKDPRGDVRKSAIEALGVIGDARAVAPLVVVLSGQSRSVHQAVIEALAKIGDPRAVEPLIAVFRDDRRYDYREVRKSAVEGLGQLGDARAVEPLIAALREEWVRVAAATALGQLGDARAVAPLLAILKNQNGDVRQAAAKALVVMYVAGRLDKDQRAVILSLRETLTAPRTHTFEHSDYGGCGRAGDTRHGDEGIGIEFPI